MEQGRPFDIKPAGMLALDVARVEAGLLLIDVDFFGSKKALIESQKYTPYEMGLGRLVSLTKAASSASRRFARSISAARRGRSSASRSTGPTSRRSTRSWGCRRPSAPTASRVGRAGLPRRAAGRPGDHDDVVAGAEEDDRARDRRPPHFADGTVLEIEVTVEAVRHRVRATVVQTPFFNPARKMATRRPEAGSSRRRCPGA